MSLLFNMPSRLVIAFLPRSKRLSVSWFHGSTVILEPKKIKSVTVSTFSPSICHEVTGPDAMIVAFLMLSFKQVFLSPLSPSSRGSLVLLHRYKDRQTDRWGMREARNPPTSVWSVA